MEEREAGSAYPSIGARVRLSIGYQNKERRESPCHEFECEERKRERERESGARERDTEFANRANGPEGLVGRRRYKYRLAQDLSVL